MISFRRKTIKSSDTYSPLLVNLGCGPVQPPKWVNVDYSNRARLVKYFPLIDRLLIRLGLIPPTEFSGRTTVFDVRKPLPFDDATVRAFYSGELWEHLLPDEAESLTRECFRALSSGGHLRIKVPNNYLFWKRYCDAYEEMVSRPRNLWDDEYAKHYIGEFFEYICSSRPFLGSMGHFHKWAYDEVSLVLMLERVGFEEVGKRPFNESNIPDIGSVEKKDHLTVEGTKPSR